MDTGHSLKERSENASTILKQMLVETMFPLTWQGPWIRLCMFHTLPSDRFFPSFHEQYHSYISKLLVTWWAVCLLTQMKWHSPVWWAAQFNLLCPMSIWFLASYQGGLQVHKVWRWSVAGTAVLHKQCPQRETEYCQRNCRMFDRVLFFKSMPLLDQAEWESRDQENLTQVKQC